VPSKEMIKLKRVKIEQIRKMLVGHLVNYPAILVMLKRVTGFPIEVYNIQDRAELAEVVGQLVKGLTWKKPKE